MIKFAHFGDLRHNLELQTYLEAYVSQTGYFGKGANKVKRTVQNTVCMFNFCRLQGEGCILGGVGQIRMRPVPLQKLFTGCEATRGFKHVNKSVEFTTKTLQIWQDSHLLIYFCRK